MKPEAVNSGAEWKCQECRARSYMMTNCHGLSRLIALWRHWREGRAHTKATGHTTTFHLYTTQASVPEAIVPVGEQELRIYRRDRKATSSDIDYSDCTYEAGEVNRT